VGGQDILSVLKNLHFPKCDGSEESQFVDITNKFMQRYLDNVAGLEMYTAKAMLPEGSEVSWKQIQEAFIAVFGHRDEVGTGAGVIPFIRISILSFVRLTVFRRDYCIKCTLNFLVGVCTFLHAF
jgi:hypothetical protein